MMHRLPFLFLSFAVFAACSIRAALAEEPKAAAASAPKVSYFKDIRPIFQDRCQGCHQPAKRGGEFVMTSLAEIHKNGKSKEPAIVPGEPDDSLIVNTIEPIGDLKPTMPKDADPLTKAQTDLIRRWIEEGAKDDTPASANVVVDADHPPTYVSQPVITSVAYSPDGSLLAVSGYHEAFLYKGDGSELVARLIGMSERVQDLKFSPDGKLLAVVGGSPGRFGEVQVWDVATKALNLSIPVTYDTVYGVSWSSDGTKIAFGCGDNTVRAIDSKTGKQVLYQGAHSDWALDTVFSTDNSHLVSVGRDRTAKLTEVATERFVDNITSITPGALKGGLLSVDRHPTKDEVVLGGADGIPKTYQMYRTKARIIGDDFNLLRTFEGMPGRVFAVAYDPEGKRIACGSSADGKGEVRIYQEADAKLLLKFANDHGPVYSVAWRSDGKELAVGGFDGTVRIYNADDGKLVKAFEPAPAAAAVASR